VTNTVFEILWYAYHISVWGAFAFFYIHYDIIKVRAFAIVAARINRHLRWGKRNEAMYMTMMMVCVLAPIANSFFAYLTLRYWWRRRKA